MTDLIQITQTTIGTEYVNSVTAREFYEYLGLKKSQFARWSNKHIVKNDYAFDNIDYIGFDINVEGNEVKDYILSEDFAYKIAMKSKGEKAEDIRNMFIRLKNEKQSKSIMSPNQITEALSQTTQSLIIHKEALQQQDERMDAQHERINEVEEYIKKEIETRPVDHAQQSSLLSARHKKVFDLLKIYETDSSDKELVRKLYAKIGSLFKKEFSIPRYNALPSSKFNEGIEFLNGIKLKDI